MQVCGAAINNLTKRAFTCPILEMEMFDEHAYVLGKRIFKIYSSYFDILKQACFF